MIRTLRAFGRPWQILAILGLLLAVVLAFVPLFNIVGYESAAFFGVFYGFTTAFLSFDDHSLVGWARHLGRRLLLLAAPFAVLTLNALRVQNCDYVTGVEFWLAIPVMSIVVATTLGWTVRNFVRGRLAWTLIAAVCIATVVEFGLRLALEPPIVGYHWFLGYFSGSIYDEALSLPDPLVAYRLIQLFGVATALCAVQAVRSAGNRRRTFGALAAVLAAITVGLFATRSDHGIDMTRGVIADELGGVVETEHFIIYYPANERFEDELPRLIDDHEYRYAEMEAYFGTDPVELHGAKVRSFVYPSREAKGRLMGARRTLVAKIWLREMHILWRFYGDHMLAHELAHVFTEPFGSGPMRLSGKYGVGVNMGLVEGIATAADWDAEALDPHEASAALREMDQAPDIDRLVGASGFWTQSSGRAYILMGSFVRWLVDTYGMEKFRQAYGTASFEPVYGKPASALVTEWEAFVDAIELTDDQRDRAKFRYDRKSIFQKVCARTVAELRLEARRKATSGDRDAALAIFEQILEFDPDNVNYRLQHARFLRTLGRNEEASTELSGLLDEELDAVHRAQALELAGDLRWLAGDADAARSRYSECLRTGLPVSSERLLRVKTIALGSSDSKADLARSYLVDDVDDDIRLFFPGEWVRRHPDDPIAAYLLGRRLWAARQWDYAEPYLRQGLAVEEGVLRDEASMMWVQTLYFTGDLQGAADAVRSWAPSNGYYAELRREWRRRVDWKRGNRLHGR